MKPRKTYQELARGYMLRKLAAERKLHALIKQTISIGQRMQRQREELHRQNRRIAEAQERILNGEVYPELKAKKKKAGRRIDLD